MSNGLPCLWSSSNLRYLVPKVCLGLMAKFRGTLSKQPVWQHISHSLYGPLVKTMRCNFRHFPLLLSPPFSPQMYFYAAYVFQEAGIPQDKIPYVIIGTGSCELITSVTCVRLLMHSDSGDSEEAVKYKCWVYLVSHAKEVLHAQQPGSLSALMSRRVDAEVFCQTLHHHHCPKSLKSVALLLCVNMDRGRVWTAAGMFSSPSNTFLAWLPPADSCLRLSRFLLRSG